MFSFSVEMIDHTAEFYKRLDLSFASLSNTYSHPYRDRQLAGRGRSTLYYSRSTLPRSLKNCPAFVGRVLVELQQYLGDLADGLELVWVFLEPKWSPHHAVRQRHISIKKRSEASLHSGLEE